VAQRRVRAPAGRRSGGRFGCYGFFFYFSDAMKLWSLVSPTLSQLTLSGADGHWQVESHTAAVVLSRALSVGPVLSFALPWIDARARAQQEQWIRLVLGIACFLPHGDAVSQHAYHEELA
jgi:hypothetical protein